MLSTKRVMGRTFGYVLALMLLSGPALLADTSTLVTFTGGYSTDPNSYYGIGPYSGTLGNQSELFYCVDFSHDIIAGQSWNVTVTNLTGSNYSATYLGSSTTYLEMAWLVTQLHSAPAGSAQAAADQWAIWALSAKSVPIPLAYSGSTGPLSVIALDKAAQAAVANGFTVNGWEILTPTSGNGQEFLITPEPATWLYALGGILFVLVLKQKALLA